MRFALEFVMSQTTQERNKALVLEAFDALFNNNAETRKVLAPSFRERPPPFTITV